jgi:TetR/AcrR family transcriptional regulator
MLSERPGGFFLRARLNYNGYGSTVPCAFRLLGKPLLRTLAERVHSKQEECMSWQRATRREQKAERVSAILEAAAELYTTREFDDVHMVAIAERVGLAKASLYEYFRTKDDVFIALALQDVESWASDVESRLRRLRRPDAERIAAALTAALRGQARLLRLRLTVRSILERRPAIGEVAEFTRCFFASMQRVAAALNAACPQLTPEDVTEFGIQHQAVNAGLWSMTHPPKKLDAACDLSEFRSVGFDFFELFERTIHLILRGLLEDSKHRTPKTTRKKPRLTSKAVRCESLPTDRPTV